MIPNQIVQLARDLSGCRTDEIDDSSLFNYLNIEYRKLWQDVADADKNYKLREWTTDVVAGVSKYDLQPVDNNAPQSTGQIKLEMLLIKYDDTQTDKFRAEQRDWDNLEKDPAYYARAQSRYKPFYIITDNAIQIFPTPTTSVPEGLVLLSSQRPYDLTNTMTGDDILIENEFHDVIAWAIIPYIYQHRQQDDRVLYYQQQFEQKKQYMLRKLKKRAIRPMQ